MKTIEEKHDYLSPLPANPGDRYYHGYPDECRDFAMFSDSLSALITDGAWMIQPFTQKMAASVVDFVSTTESEAAASIAHGWNGAWEFPMGHVNTVHSRTETNAQNARMGRHLSLIGTGFTMRDFFWNVCEKLLDSHTCADANCAKCKSRFPRDLAMVFTLLAQGLGLETVHLFSKWEPSPALRQGLAGEGIALHHRALSDIPAADLEANRYYSIWDGSDAQSLDFLAKFWSPSWR